MKTQVDGESLLETLLPMILHSGELIRQVYDGDFQVEEKSPGDPVTVADKRVNAYLCAQLAEKFPNAPVVGEESEPSTYEDFADAPLAFFVDPLDGTRDFVKRNGEFVAMIGLTQEAKPLAGMIHSPVTECTWFGMVGWGALCIAKDGSRQAIRVSERTIDGGGRLVKSRSRPSRLLDAVVGELAIASARPLGSAGLKGVAVATADADVYLQPGGGAKYWDSCAPAALVLAAGGAVSDGYGRPLDFRDPLLQHPGGFVLANAACHRPVVSALAKYRHPGRRRAQPKLAAREFPSSPGSGPVSIGSKGGWWQMR